MTLKSPEYIRTSTAAAITLKLAKGRFYRNTRLGCINILLEYPDGCSANCAYCGLASQRQGSYTEKSFIRVNWPVVSMEEMICQMVKYSDRLGRVCISMITHPDAVNDTVTIIELLKQRVTLPISVLICPTVTDLNALNAFHKAGVDKVGIAIDAATQNLFDQHRGKTVNGPHHWDDYWSCFKEAVTIFGKNNVGTHLMVGLGETEMEMVQAILKTRQLGGFTHLFSFFPEPGSALADLEPPALETYRRIQLIRYLIDNNLIDADRIRFDDTGKIISYGMDLQELAKHIKTGKPFETSGCQGHDGNVACNRPFANSLPGRDVRNLPYTANHDDLVRIIQTLNLCIDL